MSVLVNQIQLQQTSGDLLLGSGIEATNTGTALNLSVGTNNIGGPLQSFVLGADYSPTQLATSSTDIVYNPSALFWTIGPITPQFPKSLFYIKRTWQVAVYPASAASVGLFIGIFSSNVTGAPHLYNAVDGYYAAASPGTGTGTNSPVVYGNMGCTPGVYPNTTGAAFSLYICAWRGSGVGAQPSQTAIFSNSASSASPTKPYSFSQIFFIEVPQT